MTHLAQASGDKPNSRLPPISETLANAQTLDDENCSSLSYSTGQRLCWSGRFLFQDALRSQCVELSAWKVIELAQN
ncbi:MAG: hypothetical protein HC852_16250 [Acaryochloridaceae cyanobacterium RU_4_10]|nr:hypothetical protein [Acaryochloridaceae cyanobacterium RU_4_10]